MRSAAIVGFRLAMLVATMLGASLTFPAADKIDGASVYRDKGKCLVCHGVDGKGFSALKTPDFTDPKWQAATKDKDILTVIKQGKKDTAMQAFGDKLTDGEIQAVVAYIRSLNSSKKKK